ncbi:probable methyltransferase PMT10 [Olea europaea subsp. europaea]|uniref:Methyltransferase n=1 Tax=Olea europaea subsp. europaea TaxID=158383 RepID=A0A8S0RPD7_OLEEU|nr:probable methyltransferase PMT10 [Olea europaea subsp. europaea]
MNAMFTSSSSATDNRHGVTPVTTTTIPSFIKIASIFLLSSSLFFLFKHSFDATSTTPTPTTSLQERQLSFFPSTDKVPFAPSLPPPPRKPRFERTGIVDQTGAMTEDFVVGEFDESLIQSVMVNESDYQLENYEQKVIKVDKFRVCDSSTIDIIPCLDNMEANSRSNSSEKVEKYQRNCPQHGKGLDCLVPRPKDYKLHIPWPKSRDEVWYDNIPHTNLVEDKGGQNLISRQGNKYTFSAGRTQFIHSANEHLNRISKMVPEIAFGKRTRVALDIGCGVASFGAHLMERNVTTLSIASKDLHNNQIQFALERGVPAMVASLATHRLPYPSEAFDLIHCSSCGINWTRDDGLLLLEINRMLRAGGYFIWIARPVYEHEDNLLDQWRAMEDLTSRMCWELVEKEGYIAIWQKPLNNSCYLSRDSGVQPSLCDADNNPDNIWYVNLEPCITRLADNGYGANVTSWPARLHYPPDRLFSIKMDADKSRKEIYKADSKYWNEIVSGYVNVFHLKDMGMRNVMDMKAGYGGFAAALHDLEVDCWVMNVVPISGPNTLPLIFDRGLIGVMHDWCEPFETYPRTYDLLNAVALFSAEQKRCNITNIMLEMDRILRPGGRAYIRDTISVIYQLQETARAMGWVTFMFDSDEGPYSTWKLMTCEKRL